MARAVRIAFLAPRFFSNRASVNSMCLQVPNSLVA